MQKNTPKKSNHLKELIYINDLKECSKQTQKRLFRSILEPILNSDNQGIVLVRCFDVQHLTGLIQRLQFSDIKVYSFCDNLKENIFDNMQKENIWGDTEFLIVLAHRYSAMLVWDYSLSAKKDFCNISITLNSKKITDVCKQIAKNSLIDFSTHIDNFQPDRRENETMNKALGKIVDFASETNEELLLKEAENATLENNIDLFHKHEIASKQIHIISHEIKNNLSVVDLYSKVIEKRMETPSAQNTQSVINAVNCIKRATLYINTFLHEMNTFRDTKLEPVGLDEIITNSVELASLKANEHAITIKVENQFDFPILADKMKLVNVLLNLIYNSIEATPPDRENPTIIIKTDIKDDFAYIRIIDNGSGIEEKYQNSIFDLDFTTKIDGNGIGLYISKGSMQEQNGDLILVSSDKKNTIFELKIPLADS